MIDDKIFNAVFGDNNKILMCKYIQEYITKFIIANDIFNVEELIKVDKFQRRFIDDKQECFKIIFKSNYPLMIIEKIILYPKCIEYINSVL